MYNNIVLSDNEKKRRIQVARNQYLRNWRKKNKNKYIETTEKFWLRQYEMLAGESNCENKKEVEHDDH